MPRKKEVKIRYTWRKMSEKEATQFKIAMTAWMKELVDNVIKNMEKGRMQ